MTDRYTDAVNGLNANNGTTLLTPKKDPSAHTATNGDTFYIKGNDSGVMYDNPGVAQVLNLQNISGLTVREWPGFPKPVFTHTGPGVGFGAAMWFGSGLVQNIVFKDTVEAGLSTSGVAGADVIVESCEFYNIGVTKTANLGAGISFGASGAINSLKVYRSTVVNTGGPNIFGQISGTYEVSYCTLSNPGLGNIGGNTGDCVESSIAPTVYWVHHNRLIHAKNSKQCVQQSGGSTGIATIEDNEMAIGMGTSGNSCKAIYLEMPCIIRRNRIITAGFAYNGLGPSCIFNSNIVIVTGTGWGSNQGPVFPEGLADVDNNTIILQSDGTGFFSAISMYESFPGSRARNNLICNFPVGIRRHSTSTTESFNFFSGCPIPVADENLVTIARSSTSLTGKPLLRNDIYPDLASPVIGVGTQIAGYTDFFGAPYNPRPSMGAVERPRSMVRWERGVPYR